MIHTVRINACHVFPCIAHPLFNPAAQGQSCDEEYPFASTLEAQNGQGGIASTRELLDFEGVYNLVFIILGKITGCVPAV